MQKLGLCSLEMRRCQGDVMAVFTYLKDGEISAVYLWRENLNNWCKEQ